ncbi:MAG TPA: hypothetical protein VMT47_02275 [Polyangia bacterium]|nr:hypothetical protein [Polyangia bacterium]
MKANRGFASVLLLSLALLLLGAACGSVSPSGPGAGGSGGGQTGAAGVTGGAGTAGAAGMTGGAGTTGAAGTPGTGGSGGVGGMSGRVPQKHRAAAVACPTDRPAGLCTAPNVDAGFGCAKDADCTAGTNGRCSSGGRLAGCQCSYDTCSMDADCAQMGGPCECRSTAQGIVAPATTTSVNVCKMGNCRVDHDCGAGGYCSPSLGSCGNYGGVVGYYCHTTKDTCVDDSDCQVRGGAGDCR